MTWIQRCEMVRDSHVILTCLGLSLIIQATGLHTGLNGSFVWRQADVYSQILGLLGQGGLTGLMNFQGNPSFYDVPLYQVCVAAIVYLLDTDPLATARAFNLLIWGVFFSVGVSLAEAVEKGAGKFLAVLLAGAPLYLHYFGTPLPDLLALTLGLVGLWGLSRANRLVGAVALSLAALIKSPVALIFVVFAAVRHLMLRQPVRRFEWALLGLLLLIAIGAEAARKIYLADQTYLNGHDARFFAQSPVWYFGTLADRLNPGFWAAVLLGAIGAPFAHPALGAVIVGLCLIAAFRTQRSPETRAMCVAAVAAFLAGWMVFPRLYRIHDYYQLPTVFAVLFACALIAASLQARWRGARIGAWVAPVLILCTLPLSWYGQHLRAPERVSQYEVMEHLAQTADRVLLVTDAPFGEGPVFGGWIGRQFDRQDSAHFADHQAQALQDYDFIAIRQDALAVAPKPDANRTVIALETYTLFLRQ